MDKFTTENKNWSYTFFKDEMEMSGYTREEVIASSSHYIIKNDVMLNSVPLEVEPKPQVQPKQPVAKMLRTIGDFDRMAEEILGTREITVKDMKHTQTLLGIVMHSVDFSFDTRAQLDLSAIVEEIVDVAVISLDRKNELLTLKLTNPKVHAVVQNDGKVFCTGAGSEEMARKAGRFLARALSLHEKRTVFSNFKITAVHATGYMPWDIDIDKLNEYKNPTFSSNSFKVWNFMGKGNHLEIFNTGAVNIWAPNILILKIIISNLLRTLQPFSRVRTVAENRIVRNIFYLGNKTGGFDLNLIANRKFNRYPTHM